MVRAVAASGAVPLLVAAEKAAESAESVLGLVEKASASSSTKGNPIELTAEEMRDILERAM